ncbi:MAG: hypothetical protein AAGA56_01260 [Myxococcota bacterium]
MRRHCPNETPGRRPVSTARRSLALGLFASLATSCFTGDEGRRPSPSELYYPTAILTSPGGTTLFVANSNFDLQFSGGSVFALDLEAMRTAVTPIATGFAEGGEATAVCASVGLAPNDNPWIEPGPCRAFGVGGFVRSFAFTGTFASGMALTSNPDGEGARLFVSVRSDPSITYFDVADDRDGPAGFALNCQQNEDNFCGFEHRIGQDPTDSGRSLTLAADPVGLATSRDGSLVVAAHQTQQASSLVSNPWDGVPSLAFTLTNLASGPNAVTSLPEPALVAEAEETLSYTPGFAISFRGAPEVDVVRFIPDAGSVPARPFLTREGVFPVTVNASAFDSRGIAVWDAPLRSCEAGCEGSSVRASCLALCAERAPSLVFMANRSPASLVVSELRLTLNERDGQPRGLSHEVVPFSTIPLNFGPTRVEVGQVIDPDGELVDRIFAVCFDARQIFIIDPTTLTVERVIRTGRGPQDIAFDIDVDSDERHAFLYVAHFTDSYVAVADLDQRRPRTYGQLFASIGEPVPPIEVQ